MCIRDSLRGVQRNEIQRGQVLAKPGSITPHTKFKAEVYVLTKEEGGYLHGNDRSYRRYANKNKKC